MPRHRLSDSDTDDGGVLSRQDTAPGTRTHGRIDSRLAGRGWLEDGLEVSDEDAAAARRRVAVGGGGGGRSRRRLVSPRRASQGDSGLSLEVASSEDEPTVHFAARGETYVAQYDFDRKSGNQLSLRAGQRMVVLSRKDRDWWRVRLGDGQTGEVPESYIVPADSRAGSRSRSRSRSPGRARSRSTSPTRRPRRSRSVSPARSGRGSSLRSRVVQLHNMIDQDDSILDEELPQPRSTRRV
eukprot:COSAG06_NODE_6990_length_2685_cov_1.935035_3_plen_239_part_01